MPVDCRWLMALINSCGSCHLQWPHRRSSRSSPKAFINGVSQLWRYQRSTGLSWSCCYTLCLLLQSPLKPAKIAMNEHQHQFLETETETEGTTRQEKASQVRNPCWGRGSRAGTPSRQALHTWPASPTRLSSPNYNFSTSSISIAVCLCIYIHT